jgi:HD-GYP domain-containing protein (c-di-GMP phosphodiesterase class II)
MLTEARTIRTFDAVKALAFIGDLSMGQPTDHSIRTAYFAVRLARSAGYDDAHCDVVREAALLRWSGCTANASGFAEELGDDIAGRKAMLAIRPEWTQLLDSLGGASVAFKQLVQIHCEVSGEVARILGLDSATGAVLRHIFETWDGHGLPDRMSGAAVPNGVFVVSLAGDLEIFSRVYGHDRALDLIAERAESRYPNSLVSKVVNESAEWIRVLETLTHEQLDRELLTGNLTQTTSPEVIGDVIDLKLPWMSGYSRSVATTAVACYDRLGNDTGVKKRLYEAGLIHGIGRASVPNSIWNTPKRLSASSWEKIRLVPYWTSRAGKQTGALEQSAELGSHAYERINGSGYFRGIGGPSLNLEARILAASVAWVSLRRWRPWRDALPDANAAQVLLADAERGRLDPQVVDALLASTALAQDPRPRTQSSPLSAREIDVLRLISRGATNKDVAKELALSPSTVRTHLENIFRKLGCTTRAVASLKASALGLL